MEILKSNFAQLKSIILNSKVWQFSIIYGSLYLLIMLYGLSSNGFLIWIKYETFVFLGIFYCILNFWSFWIMIRINNFKQVLKRMRAHDNQLLIINEKSKKYEINTRKYKNTLNDLNIMIAVTQGCIAILASFIFLYEVNTRT